MEKQEFVNNKGSIVKKSLLSACKVGQYFLDRALENDLFFYDIEIWLPLMLVIKSPQMLHTSFQKKLKSYIVKTNIRYRSTNFLNTCMSFAFLIKDVKLQLLIMSEILNRRNGDFGWGNQRNDVSRISSTSSVIKMLIRLDFSKYQDLIIESLTFLFNIWYRDLNDFCGQPFKGSLYLSVVAKIYMFDEYILENHKKLIYDTVKYIAQMQNEKGGWGFFFHAYENIDLDKLFNSTITSALITSQLLESVKLLNKLMLSQINKTVVENAILGLVNEQNKETGLWSASSMKDLLISLGHCIKAEKYYLNNI